MIYMRKTVFWRRRTVRAQNIINTLTEKKECAVCLLKSAKYNFMPDTHVQTNWFCACAVWSDFTHLIKTVHILPMPKDRISANKMELIDLGIIICLRKSEVTVERISVLMSLKN